MKFNWVSLLTALPYIIAGIQQIHHDAAGATKKQLALESLGLATAVATNVLPTEQAYMAAGVSTAVGGIIDNLVTAFHADNVPGFGNTAVPPAAPAS